METNIWEAKPLQRWRVVILVLNYFVGFLIVYPMLIKALTLAIDPYAKTIPSWIQGLTYLWMIIVSIYAGWPVLCESYKRFKQRNKSFLKIVFSLLGVFYISTMVLNLIIMAITKTNTSANQMDVVSMIDIDPILMAFSTCIYAPIVEETLFRGVFFRSARRKYSFLVAAFISAFAFGFIHVMDSLILGNFNDLWYILSYALIGFFLSFAYEKTESIFGSICLHFLNNGIALLLLLL